MKKQTTRQIWVMVLFLLLASTKALSYDIYFGHGDRVAVGYIDGSGYQDLYTSLSPMGGIALDLANGKMYFGHGDRVAVGYIDGSGYQDLYTSLSPMGGIALDLANGKMYFGHGDRIAVGYIDGSGYQDLYTSLSPMGGIAIVPEPATLFLLAFGGLALLRKRRA